MGPVNHVFKGLKKHFPKIMSVISKLHIQRSNYHGRNFEGNPCRLLLRFINRLEISDSLNEFKDTFIAIRKLNEICNEQYLSISYHKVIDNFREAWFKLIEKFPVSTPPKVHILLDHLEDYFDMTDMTLLKTSDQLIEHMHQHLHKRLIKSFYAVKDVSNPSHVSKLFRAVRHLNSYNCIL